MPNIKNDGLSYLFLRIRYIGNKAISRYLANEWDSTIKLCKEIDSKESK